ncbi:ATP-dependent nuclease [Enterococcus sp. AZ007]|uniref:ATP-dependent nuclease n=1 Tax=Enterococcus sp. AZ007 TaxID=2774839 RepID=UPI003F287DFA
MIKKLTLTNFKHFENEVFSFNSTRNIFIGENGVGKSSLLEAISLALSGSYLRIEKIGINNLFNTKSVEEFCSLPTLDRDVSKLPQLVIELYFDRDKPEIIDNFELFGKINSDGVEASGIQLKISPNLDDHHKEIQQILKIENMVFPFEYYTVEFKTFSGASFNSYKKYHKFDFSFVDTSLIDTNKELQKHIDDIYDECINPDDRAKINSNFRMTSENFINEMLEDGIIQNKSDYKLAINNHTSSGFKEKVTALKNGIDIKNFGQGEKVLLSVANSYKNINEKTRIVLIEEPENHLSHLNMLKLIDIIEKNQNIQLFIATHSGMIASRLELDKCLLISDESNMELSRLNNETVKFFKKSTHADLLTFILSKKCILVEGNAEYILLNKFYNMVSNSQPLAENVDIISVGGLSFKRFLEVAKILKKKTVVITDNDGDYNKNIEDKYSGYQNDKNLKISSDKNNANTTFEVCLHNENTKWIADKMITTSSDTQKWMLSNKSESAFRILENLESDVNGFKIPEYIEEAISWIRN